MTRRALWCIAALIGLWLTVQLTEATARFDEARADVAGRESAEQLLREAQREQDRLKDEVAGLQVALEAQRQETLALIRKSVGMAP